MLKREVFGPILHVVRFDGERLGEVCDAINATGYGLTLGLHSRIKATADFVDKRVRVGNIYVNRNQIGAVVGVQPFGGEGLSGTGPKAGGPHYLQAFAVERVRRPSTRPLAAMRACSRRALTNPDPCVPGIDARARGSIYRAEYILLVLEGAKKHGQTKTPAKTASGDVAAQRASRAEVDEFLEQVRSLAPAPAGAAAG